jgi:AcrR family transcriptional regulator
MTIGHFMNRKEIEKHFKREEILHTALKLYQEKGADFSIQELVDRVGIAKGSFYLLFPDKAALIQAMILQAIDVIDKLFQERMALARTGLERLLEMGRAYIQLFTDYPDEFALIGAFHFFKPGLGWAETIESPLGERLGQFKTLLMNQIITGQQDGSIRKDIDPALSSLLVSQVVKTFMESLAQAEKQASIKALSGYEAHQLIQGLYELLVRAFQA